MKKQGHTIQIDEYGWGIIDANAALAYTSEPIHDIAITNISAPVTVVQGETASIVVTVSNHGDFSESINVTLTDNTDTVEIGNQSTSLSTGQTLELTFNWTTTDTTSIGTHSLLAEVSNVTEETNTDNNTMSTSVSIQSPLHDVAVIALDAPLETTLGDLVSVSITVKNLGTYAETTTVTLTDTTDNTLIDTQTISGLNAGTSNIVTFSWDTTGISIGDHNLLAETSVVEGEENTSDNAMSTITAINEIQTGQIHIADIIMELQSKGKNYNAFAYITIEDENGNTINGATVSGDWNFNNNYLNSASDTTDDTGLATLESDREKAQSSDTFTITITNVEKDGYTYDLSSNAIISSTISVP